VDVVGLRRAKVKTVGLVTADTTAVTSSTTTEEPEGAPVDIDLAEVDGSDEVTFEGVESADLVHNGQKVGEILVEQGVVDQEAVDAALA
jgi:hypothetical protein